MLSKAARVKRQSIIDACRSMNTLGINQGTSGNISLRDGDGLLITPTSMPYDVMQPEDIIEILTNVRSTTASSGMAGHRPNGASISTFCARGRR